MNPTIATLLIFFIIIESVFTTWWLLKSDFYQPGWIAGEWWRKLGVALTIFFAVLAASTLAMTIAICLVRWGMGVWGWWSMTRVGNSLHLSLFFPDIGYY
jgi:hypothetical protein